jgi:hypothetical protein
MSLLGNEFRFCLVCVSLWLKRWSNTDEGGGGVGLLGPQYFEASKQHLYKDRPITYKPTKQEKVHQSVLSALFICTG